MNKIMSKETPKEQAQKDLNKIIESCKDKELNGKLTEAIDLMKKHKGAFELADFTSSETAKEIEERKISNEMKAKGASFVFFVEGKVACFKSMNMDRFMQFAEALGDDGFDKFSGGKLTTKLFPALTKMYHELLMKDLSDEIFHENTEESAIAIMNLADHVSMNKKKVTRY